LRAEVASDGTLGARVRAHKLAPYVAVIGATEAAAGEVSIRLRGGQQLPSMSVAATLAGIGRQVRATTVELWN
jgi:threonyl-tRNA synthetase